MSDYEFTSLTAEQRAAIAREQVHGFERELFGHQMNIIRLQALPADTKKDEENAKAAIKTITNAIEATAAIADDLEKQIEKVEEVDDKAAKK